MKPGRETECRGGVGWAGVKLGVENTNTDG